MHFFSDHQCWLSAVKCWESSWENCRNQQWQCKPTIEASSLGNGKYISLSHSISTHEYSCRWGWFILTSAWQCHCCLVINPCFECKVQCSLTVGASDDPASQISTNYWYCELFEEEGRVHIRYNTGYNSDTILWNSELRYLVAPPSPHSLMYRGGKA